MHMGISTHTMAHQNLKTQTQDKTRKMEIEFPLGFVSGEAR